MTHQITHTPGTCQDRPACPSITPQIDPQTGDYLIGDHSETGYNTLRLIAIGSRYAVNDCRNRLHLLGYAEPREWSQILPLGNPQGILRGLTPT
ncbi:MAG: hypothetical protein WBA10_16085, partial [Elainellaceae cyanobacterium]